jgi:CsoR family transcriptional regulator, copper-sensing transcriptional repressor
MAKQKLMREFEQDCEACTSAQVNVNPNHAGQLKRLARIRGQLDGVGRMIEQERYCIDILAQTAAIRAAIKSLEAALLEKHMAHCVLDAMNAGGDADQKIAELLAVFKKEN